MLHRTSICSILLHRVNSGHMVVMEHMVNMAYGGYGAYGGYLACGEIWGNVVDMVDMGRYCEYGAILRIWGVW